MGRPFKLERLVRVICDVGYICDNFRLPKTLFSPIRQDVRDWHTSDTHDCLMHPTLVSGHNNESSKTSYHKGVSPCGETFSPQCHPVRTN